jgi:hypothetical protein
MLPDEYVTWYSGPDCTSRSRTGRMRECRLDHVGRCYVEDSQKISLQCIHFGPFSFSSNKNGSNFIVLLSNWNWVFSIICCYQSMSCIVCHCITTVSTINLWLSRFCFSAVLSDEFPWYDHIGSSLGTKSYAM